MSHPSQGVGESPMPRTEKFDGISCDISGEVEIFPPTDRFIPRFLCPTQYEMRATVECFVNHPRKHLAVADGKKPRSHAPSRDGAAPQFLRSGWKGFCRKDANGS